MISIKVNAEALNKHEHLRSYSLFSTDRNTYPECAIIRGKCK